ncbi:MAG: Lrp/AsnC family transcriptional regulator [Candidatus Bathyarchaeota archaeon]|nr:Lrp/AsnC family transcriptional regulator [Candidatus Bathyarchaeota archaeon]MDH5419614.1 Lrp/AsnC family transcriptional regulator [Candidatus Bathyarchaeota archaeon]MDH5624118.1 Lrp/AsnC family transcriptional regulator [Candidatus Bathyarchaeota archaeon]MDH5635945.1 Lrp/AsnC family transcriptional regulator [Candidatus Bathyarchaeota archaeon]MDH5702317.1 Lrp/AsnC family transcriptional regulator [Candidatus Bathyarchaeota archaeon]
MKLDEIDYKILEILRRDARTPFTEVGRDLGISDATVHVRMKRMMDEGIIKRYTIEVAEKALGRNVCGFVLINVKPGSLEEAANQLVENEKVSGIYEIHGPNDLLVKVGAGDLDEMRDLMLKIRGIPNVTTSELITVYKVWKERNA